MERLVLLVVMGRASDVPYSRLYEMLYSKAGYHKGTGDTHGIPLVHEIRTKYSSNISSVLDVGCSHGDVVQRLWHVGKTASGVDVSPTAIARATKIRHDSVASCVEECFKVGSALDLPWSNSSFDAIVSSDVMEHIAPQDIPSAVSEFHRVCNKYVFLLVAPREEINKQPVLFLRSALRATQDKRFDVYKLHLTVEPLQWWVDVFVRDRLFECREANTVVGAHHLVLERR